MMTYYVTQHDCITIPLDNSQKDVDYKIYYGYRASNQLQGLNVTAHVNGNIPTFIGQ